MKHPISTSLTFLAVGILVWVLFFAPYLQWNGAVMKTFTVRVMKGKAKTPVHGETVLFLRSRAEAERLAASKGPERSDWLDALTNSRMSGSTSSEGLVTLSGQFGAGGTNSILWKRGSFRTAGYLIIFKTEGTSDILNMEDWLPIEKLSLNQDIPLIEVVLE